jgi:hypothetical protein
MCEQRIGQYWRQRARADAETLAPDILRNASKQAVAGTFTPVRTGFSDCRHVDLNLPP